MTTDTTMHPQPIDGASHVPWEPLGQIVPADLPAPSDLYPGPWTTQGRGNGHEDVLDGQGRIFAHVYCWDSDDFDALEKAVKASEEGHEAEIIAALRVRYFAAEHFARRGLRAQIEDRGGAVPTPSELAAAGARPELTPAEIAARTARVEAAIARGHAMRSSAVTEQLKQR